VVDRFIAIGGIIDDRCLKLSFIIKYYKIWHNHYGLVEPYGIPVSSFDNRHVTNMILGSSDKICLTWL
jgi:hypothetical protein